ncbi:MAG: FAD/FMN-containing dehydrogenase [Gammaproteobacteria bacterium]|jgi:FAD/FMN-containing dehydrogenase
MTHPSDTLIEQLTNIVGSKGILSGGALKGRSAGIWSSKPLLAKALLRPTNTEQISQILKLCNESNQSVVTTGGMTGLAEAHESTELDIVLSTERLNKILSIDEQARTITVEAGVLLQAVQEMANDHRLMFPLDLGARASCTIGGNIATNAGGVRVLRYGMMRDLVLGLEAVLADGTVITSMFNVLKNNTGYDLKQLFIGSEGTLGVVTRAILRLYESPVSTETAILAVEDWSKVMQLLRYFDGKLAGGLVAFEVLWQDHYLLNTGEYSEIDPPLETNTPYYVLIDAFISDPATDREKLEGILMHGIETGLIADGALASSETERKRFWQIRESFEPEQKKYGLIYGYDVSLPIDTMESYVEEVERRLLKQFPDAALLAYGHIGDGNLHFSIAPGKSLDFDACCEAVYRPLEPLNGSVSAEHGIGLEKKPYLSMTRSSAEIDLMRKMRKMMDPNRIMNPGKLFD